MYCILHSPTCFFAPTFCLYYTPLCIPLATCLRSLDQQIRCCQIATLGFMILLLSYSSSSATRKLWHKNVKYNELMIHACMIHCKHSIKWKPSAISISDYFHVRCPAKGMPLINPCVRFFGIGVKSHDVTTVDEPFRYSIPPLSRSASFHSFYSCPARTMKLRLWNLTKRGHSVITEFQSCSLTIFGWLLSFAGPNLIFLNIRNQPFCRGKEKGCVVEHIYAKVVPKLRPME